MAWLLGALVVLFGIIAWFLRREITRNDDAHRELRADVKVVETDVKKLLAGDVPWVAAIDSRFAAIDSRFAAIDSRFAAIDSRFVDIDSRFVDIDSRFVAMESKLVAIDSKLAGIGDLMSRRAPRRRPRATGGMRSATGAEQRLHLLDRATTVSLSA